MNPPYPPPPLPSQAHLAAGAIAHAKLRHAPLVAPRHAFVFREHRRVNGAAFEFLPDFSHQRRVGLTQACVPMI